MNLAEMWLVICGWVCREHCGKLVWLRFGFVLHLSAWNNLGRSCAAGLKEGFFILWWIWKI